MKVETKRKGQAGLLVTITTTEKNPKHIITLDILAQSRRIIATVPKNVGIVVRRV